MFRGALLIVDYIMTILCEQLIGPDNTAQRCPTYFAEFGFEVGHASCKYNYGGKPN